jgi:hypothetical protein
MKTDHFVNLPNGCSYVLVGRSGSTSLCKAICQQLFPERLPRQHDKLTHHLWYQDFLLREPEPSGICLVSMRDPVERFRSYCAYLNITDVDKVLDKLELDGKMVDGFQPVSEKLGGHSCRLFKFPDHFDSLAKAVGVVDVETLNGQPDNKKPALTKEQFVRVKDIYSTDIKMFENTNEVGQFYDN